MSAAMPAVAAGLIVVVLALVFATLADAPDWKRFFKIVAVSIALLTALIALGTVFGKTLGDFLRHPNG